MWLPLVLRLLDVLFLFCLLVVMSNAFSCCDACLYQTLSSAPFSCSFPSPSPANYSVRTRVELEATVATTTTNVFLFCHTATMMTNHTSPQSASLKGKLTSRRQNFHWFSTLFVPLSLVQLFLNRFFPLFVSPPLASWKYFATHHAQKVFVVDATTK